MTPPKKDFFVSYNRHDKAWAEWIAWELEAADYTVIIQAWDFKVGGNFVLDMQKAATQAQRTIAVLSPTYLTSKFTQPEWAAAFVQDPTGEQSILIPVRVKECNPDGLLRAKVYVDLVGEEEETAREKLLQAVNQVITQKRGKPDQPIPFPGQLKTATADRSKPVFPPDIPQNLPRISDIFVGRDEDLEKLHDQVQQGNVTAISAIAGMGGIGKTELAAQYAFCHWELGTYPGGLAWFKAREELGTQIVAFGRSRLHLTIPEDVELHQQVDECWRQWPSLPTLIVFDDVQDYEDLYTKERSFLPPQSPQFKVLLTTRSRFGSPVQNYDIQVLSETAALELLRSFVPDLGGFQNLRGLETAKQICEWLGYLPLGVELVGRYLARKPGLTLEKVWERLQAQKLAAKAMLETEAGMTASLGVTAAFELSWQELTPDAQRLAALLSLFALADIPWPLVQQCWPEIDEEALEDLRDAQLVNLSLLNYVGHDSYLLHQLLREFFAVKRSQMAEDEAMKRSLGQVMVAVAQQIPQTVTLTLIEQATPAIPHLQETATCLHPWLTDEGLIWPPIGLARFYEGQSAFGDAEEWLLQGRAIATERFGPDQPAVATSLNNLAALYRSQGRYGEAEPLYTQALAIRQRQLGPDHPDVATSLNNLAGLYRSQGRYGEAEPLYTQALAIWQRQLGPDQPAVATSLNNLAGLYRSQGRYGEAEPLYTQALAIRQRQLGPDHPAVATSLNNLAGLYESQGRYGEAEPLYLQAISIFYQRLGEAHPNTRTVWGNFIGFLRQVVEGDRTADLSDDPVTRSLLQQLQGSGE